MKLVTVKGQTKGKERKTLERMRQEQEEDPILAKIGNQLRVSGIAKLSTKYQIYQGLLFKRTGKSRVWKLCIPESMTRELIKEHYEYYGHYGAHETVHLLRESCTFTAMRRTYSGWTPQNRHIYQQVPVKFRVQNRLETIVEFMRTEMPVEDQEMIEKSMKETAKYQDNFEVYIQTLISQALDSNFLTEIFQEQDDYFLSNVKCVDEITEERKGRLLRVAQWKPSLSNSVGTWPCFNFITDLPADEKTGKLCVACDKAPVAVRVQMYGQPYNSTTLEGCQPDPKVASQKDFLVCAVCAGRVKLYNKVAHQKYLMYIECAKRVADKRLSDPKKDTTVILNELLADEAWLNQLFKTVRTSWAEIDKLEHQAKQTVPSSNKT
uniref:DUF4211 domain-containing protein n=1 Tax=Timema poppense TaxID=170557 RepID=A0A7R9D7K4_TIMPO|nr:unnamed protein product [Timema poppensis]